MCRSARPQPSASTRWGNPRTSRTATTSRIGAGAWLLRWRWAIGEDDSLIFTYLHQQENNRPRCGHPLPGRPAGTVPRDAYFGLISDHVTTEDDIGTARYKHDFNSDFSIADTLRYAHYLFDYQDAMPNSAAMCRHRARP